MSTVSRVCVSSEGLQTFRQFKKTQGKPFRLFKKEDIKKPRPNIRICIGDNIGFSNITKGLSTKKNLSPSSKKRLQEFIKAYLKISAKANKKKNKPIYKKNQDIEILKRKKINFDHSKKNKEYLSLKRRLSARRKKNVAKKEDFKESLKQIRIVMRSMDLTRSKMFQRTAERISLLKRSKTKTRNDFRIKTERSHHTSCSVFNMKKSITQY